MKDSKFFNSPSATPAERLDELKRQSARLERKRAAADDVRSDDECEHLVEVLEEENDALRKEVKAWHCWHTDAPDEGERSGYWEAWWREAPNRG